MYNKTPLTPFTLKAVGMQAVSINDNLCIAAKELCRTPEYGKITKDADVLKCFVAQKTMLTSAN